MSDELERLIDEYTQALDVWHHSARFHAETAPVDAARAALRKYVIEQVGRAYREGYQSDKPFFLRRSPIEEHTPNG